MSKKFYGVYGFNGGGVYTNWYRVEKGQKYVQGIKYKSFETQKEAVDFVIEGLTQNYKVGDFSQLNQEALYSNTNYFIYSKDLFNHIEDETKNLEAPSRNVFDIIKNIQCELQTLETLIMEKQAENEPIKKEPLIIFRSVEKTN